MTTFLCRICDTPTEREFPTQTLCVSCARDMEMGAQVATLHNPDRLTSEQIGVADGWRLLDEDEIIDRNHILIEIEAYTSSGWRHGQSGKLLAWTYRTKLSRAELRKARNL